MFDIEFIRKKHFVVGWPIRKISRKFGYLGLGPGGALLFQFCAERYERGSVLITSNLDFSRWVEVFGDATLTAALLDRLTHHSHILLFQGESHRFRESRQRLQEVPLRQGDGA